MRELQTIADAWREIENESLSAALATVVKVEGSAYRRAGARMLIAEDGRTWGGVSGGCLEADVILRAQAALQTHKAVVACYDSRDDADLFFGTGLGCNGAIHVLIEPVAGPHNFIRPDLLQKILDERKTIILATLFRADNVTAPIGAKCLLNNDGSVDSNISDAVLLAAILQDARHALRIERSTTKTYALAAGEAEVFIEALVPPPALAIFGAGDDTKPLARVAKELGWRVIVADRRPAYVTAQRFPSADALVLGTPEEAVESAGLNARALALVATHNYLQDRALLPLLLQSPARYIGVLGPKRRTERLLHDLEHDGRSFTSEQMARLYAPVGLDIGAETPTEVALSIAAEMQAVLAGRGGAPLREGTGPIHANAVPVLQPK